MSWPMLCFYWVFSDWWLKIQRVGVVKHSTPTQSFLKCMFMLSFSTVPLDLCHCRSALPAPQAENRHPVLSCTSPEMYPSSWWKEHTLWLTSFKNDYRALLQAFEASVCHTKTNPSPDSILPVLSKNVAGCIVPYKIICFLCKNSCNKIMNIRCLFIANVLTLHKKNASIFSPEQPFLLLMPQTHRNHNSTSCHEAFSL